jgi:spermidine synthase
MLGDVIVCLAFALSGAAGLIFQVVWFHRASLVFGGSLWSVTAVLSGFMGGLAVGNALAARYASRSRAPFKTYAALELVVAVSGIGATSLLSRLTPLLVPVLALVPEASWQMQALRFLSALAVLLIPATAMGATFPVLVGAWSEQRRALGVTLGWLYGWNTVGAVMGVLAADVFAIPRAGVGGATWIAASLNVLAAALVLSFVRNESKGGSETRRYVDKMDDVAGMGATLGLAGTGLRPAPALSAAAALTLVCAALSGAILLALEVIWFRFLSMFVLSTTLAASLMLAAVLAGIATGGLVASIWLRRSPVAVRYLPSMAYASGAATLLSFFTFQFVTSGTQVGDWRLVVWFAVALTFPTACLSGVLFTLMAEVLSDVSAGLSRATRTAGRLTLANTTGAFLGAPLATFVLLPTLGLQLSAFLLAVLYGAIGAIAMVTLRSLRRPDLATPPRFALVALGALIAILALFPSGTMRERYFARAAQAYAADGSKVVALREGPSETIFLMEQEWMGKAVYHRLVTNGFSMSGTAVPGQRYMRYFAYWPMLMHRGPIKDALLVCYGVGVTAGAVLEIPQLATLDVAEISRDVVAVSDRIYPPAQHPLHDPRVQLHIEDGRFFLETTTKRFDLITGEPPPPRSPGTVNIYTREFFQLVYDHLNEGGMATYWVPVARPDPGTDIDTVIRAFCDVFDDCSLWNATPFDFMIAGSRHATGGVTLDEFTAPWQTPKLQTSLRDIGFERPEQIGATFLGDRDYLRQLTASTPALVDDFPQRLRPDPSRPSLSDPRYATDASVAARFQDVLNPSRARIAFQSSALVQRFFPAGMIERSLPFFTYQGILNQAIWDGGQPLAHIEDLHMLLTTTTLRTLPLWVLGSDDVRQRIAESGDDGTGQSDYARGLRALTGRDYAGAAASVDRARTRGLAITSLVPLEAYALMMAGRVDEARALIPASESGDEDTRHFWLWLRGKTGRPQ